MRLVFADTFYWAALTSRKDTFYKRAMEFNNLMEMERTRIITTDDVLVEYLAFFAQGDRPVREQAGYLAAQLFTHPRIQIIPQSRELFFAGLQLYRDRPDKGYSLTDCISMLIMRREGLNDVLTNDHHFEQEGFRVLFREN